MKRDVNETWKTVNADLLILDTKDSIHAAFRNILLLML